MTGGIKQLGRSSFGLAALLALALLVWMASGLLPRDSEEQPEATASHTPRSHVVSVRVRELRAEPVRREIVISGRTEPARAVTLRAELDSRITGVPVPRGSAVSAGDLLVVLDQRDRTERLTQAQATLRQRELQYKAAKRLRKEDYQTETQLAESLANLQAARATVRQREVELANTRIQAPFDGVLDQRPVEVGAYVKAGDEVARLLETDPLLVTGYVTEQDVQWVVEGTSARASLVDGQQVEGLVSFVGSESDPSTRMFRVEMEVENPGGELVAGVTSEIHLPTDPMDAHFLSPSLLGLDDAGQVGIKGVSEDDRVVFYPVQMVRAEPRGVWVTGLPSPARIITVGQGYVRAGDAVKPVLETDVAHRAPIE